MEVHCELIEAKKRQIKSFDNNGKYKYVDSF